jgi:CheY-like chemotaxis protein
MDTVLIVDDSSFIVEGLIAFLKKSYRTIAAYGGAECLEILKRETPAVIILDIMMEPMDGWETLTRIKENPETRHIPVLMFSAKKISPGEAEKHRFNIDDFIMKPVSPKKITEAIEKVLERRDTNRVVVERWEAAGIAREKIDEYLSLVTSLEVDLSLCQNMKIQFDIVPHTDTEQAEFRAVIEAIEDRILHERDLVEALSREMNGIVDQRESSRKTAVPESSPVPPDDTLPAAGVPESPASGESGTPPEPPVPELPAPESPPADAGPVISGQELPSGAGPAGSDRTGPGPAAAPAEPPADTEERPAPAPDRNDAPAPAVPDAAPAPSADTPAVPESPPAAFPGDDGTGGGGTQPAEPAVTPGTPAEVQSLPAPAYPAGMVRKVIPADLDLPKKTSEERSSTGAGTDVPMPWDVDRGKMGRKSLAGSGQKDIPEQPQTPSRAPGLLGRVLSFVQSILGMRK